MLSMSLTLEFINIKTFSFSENEHFNPLVKYRQGYMYRGSGLLRFVIIVKNGSLTTPDPKPDADLFQTDTRKTHMGKSWTGVCAKNTRKSHVRNSWNL